MFFKLSPRSRIKRLLLVSLSNIGDIVLTFPVFDSLRELFPEAEISVIVGPKGEGLLSGNAMLRRVIVYDKSMSWKLKLAWFLDLRRERFDLIVDLRNSMLPFILDVRYPTLPALSQPRCHMKDKHLRRLAAIVREPVSPLEKYAGFLSPNELKEAEARVHGWKDFVLFAPGAADPRKRWVEDGFAKVARHVMARYGRNVIFVGDRHDRLAADRILQNLSEGALNLCGQTSLTQLSGIVRLAGLAIMNDSGIMHLASYFDIPTIALFGPTDPFLYGPWVAKSSVIRSGLLMSDINADDVVREVDKYLNRAGDSDQG